MKNRDIGCLVGQGGGMVRALPPLLRDRRPPVDQGSREAQKPIVYPGEGESAQQQSQDEGQCYA